MIENLRGDVESDPPPRSRGGTGRRAAERFVLTNPSLSGRGGALHRPGAAPQRIRTGDD
jgi:hypothetical protein